MKYSGVYIDAIGYELPSIVVSSLELEKKLAPMYRKLHINEGQLEALTGISERRWWKEGHELSAGAVAAAMKSLELAAISPDDIECLVYAGVCRENFEPATACRVAHGIGINSRSCVYDISNACLGVLNGMVEIANRIELGQIKAGMVVSCESAREINEIQINRMLEENSMNFFITSLATLTGGSGAVAVVLTDGSFNAARGHRFIGGVTRTAPEHHALCRWGISGGKHEMEEFMTTDSVSVLKYGVQLGIDTWNAFLEEIKWSKDMVDKVICHQVGSAHQQQILASLGIPEEKEYCSFEFLGNMGTVSLPLTAALAEEYDFLVKGDKVGFLGIGSGLNCLMLGLEW